MKHYPTYKDSRIKWVGKVPKDWGIKPLKYCFAFQTGWTPSTGESENFIGNNKWATIADLRQKIIYETEKNISNDAVFRSRIKINPKGTLFYSFKLSVGKVAFAGCEMYTNEAIFSILPNSNDVLEYYYYLLPVILSSYGRENIYGANLLNQELIKNASIIFPLKSEQEAIAGYLDHKTAQIDGLIARKERMIELLKEERTAIINQVVTKGLNPKAEMRDSGIEWLGQIPKHWVTKKIKYISRVNTLALAETTDDGYEFNYIDISNVDLEEGLNTSDKINFLNAPSRARRIIKKGDTIISTVRTYLKAIAYIGEVVKDIIVSTGFAVVSPQEKTVPKFLYYVLRSEKFIDRVCALSVGVSYPAINSTELADIAVWYPADIDEQRKITEYLDTAMKKTKAAIDRMQVEIEYLKEYRTALISEVVTGKIDVRR